MNNHELQERQSKYPRLKQTSAIIAGLSLLATGYFVSRGGEVQDSNYDVPVTARLVYDLDDPELVDAIKHEDLREKESVLPIEISNARRESGSFDTEITLSDCNGRFTNPSSSRAVENLLRSFSKDQTDHLEDTEIGSMTCDASIELPENLNVETSYTEEVHSTGIAVEERLYSVESSSVEADPFKYEGVMVREEDYTETTILPDVNSLQDLMELPFDEYVTVKTDTKTVKISVESDFDAIVPSS